MNERPDVWRPSPATIPVAWLARRSPAEAFVVWIQSNVIFKLTLVVVRNLIPLAGFVAFGWSAYSVVVLGVFNVAMVFASSTSVECALPKLLIADPRRERVHTIVWAVVAVCEAWATVLCVMFMAPALLSFVFQTPFRSLAVQDPGVWWMAAGLSIAGALGFAGNLHQQIQRLRELDSLPAMKNLSIGAIAVLFFFQAVVGCWGFWLFAMPLQLPGNGGDDMALMSVVIVSASSLFLDAVATFRPTEMPGAIRVRPTRDRHW